MAGRATEREGKNSNDSQRSLWDGRKGGRLLLTKREKGGKIFLSSPPLALGFMKTVQVVCEKGGEPSRHATAAAPKNHASIATARSVGFVPYGTSLVLSAPAADLET